MGKTYKQSVNSLTQKIMHGFFEENNLDILFDVMAEDIVWLGPAKPMRAEGRANVQAWLRRGIDSLFMCSLAHEYIVTKELSEDYWLCEAVYDVRAKSTDDLVAYDNYRATFIYRRKNVNDFELVHLNMSLAWSKLDETELLAKQYAARLGQSFDKDFDLNAKEKMIITMLRHGMTNREIAEEMGLAEITIKKAMSRLFHRFGVTNRTALVTYLTPMD